LKGQISFETLLLLLVIISMTTFITILFVQTNDMTNAYSLIRSEFSVQANNKPGEIILEEIVFDKEQNTFNLITSPQELENKDFNTEIIEKKVNDLTGLDNIIIKINDN
jgi:uncharacterized protein (UPF0333 family)